jgi:hypothetical protein
MTAKMTAPNFVPIRLPFVQYSHDVLAGCQGLHYSKLAPQPAVRLPYIWSVLNTTVRLPAYMDLATHWRLYRRILDGEPRYYVALMATIETHDTQFGPSCGLFLSYHCRTRWLEDTKLRLTAIRFHHSLS